MQLPDRNKTAGNDEAKRRDGEKSAVACRAIASAAAEGRARLDRDGGRSRRTGRASSLGDDVWERRHGHLRTLESYNAGLRLIVNHPGREAAGFFRRAGCLVSERAGETALNRRRDPADDIRGGRRGERLEAQDVAGKTETAELGRREVGTQLRLT